MTDSVMDDLISMAYVLAEYDRQHQGPPVGARKIIAEAPTVDAVPVVRCKDCRHRGSNAICVKLWAGTKDSFFCAFGERRDSE